MLDRLVTEMYARGMSTRDIEDAFWDVTGELLISKSAVSEITDRLWADYQEFTARDLSEIEVEYLFADEGVQRLMLVPLHCVVLRALVGRWHRCPRGLN